MQRWDIASGAAPYGIAVGDIDGDGKSDLVVANNGGNTISVHRNVSTSGSITTSSFSPPINIMVGTTARSVTLGDIDGDGKLDIAVAVIGENKISVIRNISTSGTIVGASFEPPIDFPVTDTPVYVAIDDIDGDGKPELLVANYNSNTLTVMTNTGTPGSITSGNFGTSVDIPVGTNPYHIATRDIDGDAKSDIVVSNYNNGNITILRNTASPGSITSGSFIPQNLTTSANPTGVTITDFDGNGTLDIGVAVFNGAGISVFKGKSTPGSINFDPAVDFTAGVNAIAVATGDINGDGKPDIAVSNIGSSTVSVFENQTLPAQIDPSSFAGPTNFGTGTSPRFVLLADLDGDSKPDLITANENSGNISILRNTLGESVCTIDAGPDQSVCGIATLAGQNVGGGRGYLELCLQSGWT